MAIPPTTGAAAAAAAARAASSRLPLRATVARAMSSSSSSSSASPALLPPERSNPAERRADRAHLAGGGGGAAAGTGAHRLHRLRLHHRRHRRRHWPPHRRPAISARAGPYRTASGGGAPIFPRDAPSRSPGVGVGVGVGGPIDGGRRRLSSSSGSGAGERRDLYDVLGVPRGSDRGAIKRAYFKLAKEYHPDTNKGDQGAADKFKEVTEAYEVLSDDKQRGLYDRFGHAGVDPDSGFQREGGGAGPFGGGGMGGGGFGGFDFGGGSFRFSASGGGPGGAAEIDAEELFDAFFGGGRRRPGGPRRGSDLQMHVRLTFEEAAFGASKDLHLRYQVRGGGVKERDVAVDTPPGIDTGMNLRLQGQGAEGDPGAPRGNLLVQVIVDEDPYFRRDGADVHTDAPVSVAQAILGGTVDVRTLTGTVELRVPRGCQPDTKLLLRGKGIQRLHGGSKGNHVVHVKIEIPERVTARQEELLREFDEETRECGGGIWGGIAKAAGSAFETFFGGNKKGGRKKRGGGKDDGNGGDSDDEFDEKKRQAS